MLGGDNMRSMTQSAPVSGDERRGRVLLLQIESAFLVVDYDLALSRLHLISL